MLASPGLNEHPDPCRGGSLGVERPVRRRCRRGTPAPLLDDGDAGPDHYRRGVSLSPVQSSTRPSRAVAAGRRAVVGTSSRPFGGRPPRPERRSDLDESRTTPATGSNDQYVLFLIISVCVRHRRLTNRSEIFETTEVGSGAPFRASRAKSLGGTLATAGGRSHPESPQQRSKSPFYYSRPCSYG